MSATTGRNSGLKHRARAKVCVIRKDLVEICNDHIPAAVILGIMEHWTNVKLDDAEQKVIENEARAKEGLDPLEINLWVYKSYQHLIDDSLGLLKDHQVREGLSQLLEKGFIERRTNPKYRWDKTSQYRLCVEAVNDALIPPTPSVTGNGSTDHGQRINDSLVTDRRPARNGAIPEDLSEVTTKNLSEEDTHGLLILKEEELSDRAKKDREEDPPFHAPKSWQDELGTLIEYAGYKFSNDGEAICRFVEGETAKGNSPQSLCAALTTLLEKKEVQSPVPYLKAILYRVLKHDMDVSGINQAIAKRGEEFQVNLSKWEAEARKTPVKAGVLSHLMITELAKAKGVRL